MSPVKAPGDSIALLDATEIAARVQSGALSATEVLTACRTRVQAVEPLIHAFASLDLPAAAHRAARAPKGPLAGVPIGIKDLVAVPRLPFRLGSRLFADQIAPDPAPPFIARLEEAGAVIVGKTTTSEFGLLGSTETLLEGVTHNPWDLAFSAAGSSGGSAAAVAAGIVPVAHASDGGGSIRIPASVCGLFGLKPSRGRVVPSSLAPSPLALVLSDLCISRTVRDAALFLSVVEARSPEAPYPPVRWVKSGSPRRLRIATWSTTLLGDEPSREVYKALERVRSLCRELGHQVVECPQPDMGGREVGYAFFVLAGQLTSGLFAMMQAMRGAAVGPHDAEPFTRELVTWANGLAADASDQAQRAIVQAGARYCQVFEDADVVLTPTLAVEPWLIGWQSPTLGRSEGLTRTERAVGYTPIHNFAGTPSMSVPLAWTERGMPIGACFSAAPGGDATLLSLAYELEAAAPWREYWPPFSYPALYLDAPCRKS